MQRPLNAPPPPPLAIVIELFDGGSSLILTMQFLDTSTEFLFGQTVNSLDHPERDWPQKDMVAVMRGLRLRLQLSSFLFLHRDKEWFAACKRIHGFLEGYIDKAYQQLEEERRTGKSATYANGEPRNDFLWTIARHVPDKLELRTQLTGVWIPSNETTSIHMSHAIFALARHPEVVKKLRKEILNCGDKALTFEGLRSMDYLRWTVNESECHKRSNRHERYKADKCTTPSSPLIPSQLADRASLHQRHHPPRRQRQKRHRAHLLRQRRHHALQSLPHAPGPGPLGPRRRGVPSWTVGACTADVELRTFWWGAEDLPSARHG